MPMTNDIGGAVSRLPLTAADAMNELKSSGGLDALGLPRLWLTV